MNKTVEILDESGPLMVFKDGFARQDLSEALDVALKNIMEHIPTHNPEQVPELLETAFLSAIAAVYHQGCTIGDENYIPIATFAEVTVIVNPEGDDEGTLIITRKSKLN